MYSCNFQLNVIIAILNLHPFMKSSFEEFEDLEFAPTSIKSAPNNFQLGEQPMSYEDFGTPLKSNNRRLFELTLSSKIFKRKRNLVNRGDLALQSNKLPIFSIFLVSFLTSEQHRVGKLAPIFLRLG